MKIQDIELIKINRDVNGNSRYVTHFYNILGEKEQSEIYDKFVNTHDGHCIGVRDAEYSVAIEKAKSIGGKRYRGKDFGGGIVFQSTMPKQLRADIHNLRGE